MTAKELERLADRLTETFALNEELDAMAAGDFSALAETTEALHIVLGQAIPIDDRKGVLQRLFRQSGEIVGPTQQIESLGVGGIQARCLSRRGQAMRAHLDKLIDVETGQYELKIIPLGRQLNGRPQGRLGVWQAWLRGRAVC